MSHVLAASGTDQIAFFRAYNTDGSPKTDLTSATSGLSLSVFRVGASAVSISSLSDKAADNTTHADGAIRAVSGNLYTVDLPDAACATQVPSIAVKGSYTGGVVEGISHPIVGYNPASVAVGANTTAPPTASTIASQVRTELTTELGRIDAAVTSRMASYTQPTGFLAATFPTTVASTTNITAASGIALAANQDVRNVSGTISDKTGYELTSGERDDIASVVDARLLDAGDATDLIAGIVSRIGNTNVDEAALVVAIKAALFDAGSVGNKLTVNASGQVPSSNMRGTDNALTTLGSNAPTGWINAAALASDSITAAKIQDGAFTSAKFATAISGLWTNLIAMVTGSGVNAKYTETALENAPAGEGGGGGGATAEEVWEYATRTLTSEATADPALFYYTPGQTLWAYPESSLYESDRVACTETGETNDAGDAQYSVQLNAALDSTWFVFVGNTVPDDTESAVYRLETSSLVPIVVAPLTGVVLSGVEGTNIDTFTGESKSFAIAVTDASGAEIDVEDMTLNIVIEDRFKSDIATIGDGSIGKSGNTVTFTIPGSVTTEPRQLPWTLWNEDVMLLQGLINVRYVPMVDA